MAWFSNQWNRWTDNEAQSKEVRRVEVAWGRERLQVVIPADVQPARIGDLRAQVSALTSIPANQVKLVFNGLVLRDDRSTLASYGVRDGGRVLLLGTAGGASTAEGGKGKGRSASGVGARPLTAGEEAARAKRRKENDTSEQGLLRKIAEVRDHTRADLLPELEQLEASVQALPDSSRQDGHDRNGLQESTMSDTTAPAPSSNTTASSASPQSTTIAHMHATHRRLSEFLLRALLSLDSVPVNNEVTRQARKLVVKEVQGYLDRADGAWAAAKDKGATALV